MLAKKKDQLFLYSAPIKLSVNDKGIIVAKMRLNDGNTSSFNTDLTREELHRQMGKVLNDNRLSIM